MKKGWMIIPIMLILVLGSSTIGLADTINTNWNFTGPGEFNIYTGKYGGPADGTDYLHVETYGSGSSGWNLVTVQGPPHSYWDEGTSFSVDRVVWIEDGYVETYTVRSNHGMNGAYYWHADTEYGARLNVNSEGTLEQHFQNSYFAAHMNTDIWANGSYDMGAMATGSNGGYYFFGIGADGDGEGNLHLYTTDWANHGGCECLQGNFYVDADSNADFYTEWGNYAVFGGSIETPNLYQTFDVDVDGSGDYSKDASGSWVIIDGSIYGGQYVGMN